MFTIKCKYLCPLCCSIKPFVKIQYFSTKQSILGALILFLLLPALLINLGLVAFYDDEAIRALVAMEMNISGEFITPTMFGELYYNKPPLYNWILHAVFEITNRNDEFICRLVTVLFLLVYAGSVYYFFRRNMNGKCVDDWTGASPPYPPRGGTDPFFEDTTEVTLNKNFNRISFFPLFPSTTALSPLGGGRGGMRTQEIPTTKIALITSLALITCGRILFWESMLGLIDICFSWIIFLLFMVIFQEGEKKRYGRLFIFSYLLAAIGYMLKGLPAVAFLGIALLTYFIWQKKIKQLFSIKHILGGILFLIIVGGYYFLYSQQNGLEEILKTVFHESAKRTFVEHGLGDTLFHFFTFPFEMWYHFLPWTFLIICLFRKNVFNILKENKFIFWNILVFITTVLPYWASVEVYPRYLLMHVPLVFSALFYFYFKKKKENGWQAKTVEMVFFASACLSVIAALLPMGWEQAKDVPFRYVKSISVAAILVIASVLFWKWKTQRMLVFVLVLLAARIGYDYFILPSRVKVECSTQVRESSKKAVEMAAGEPIYIYKNSLGFQPMTGYYFTRETGKILEKKFGELKWETFYLVHPGNYDARIFKKYEEIKIKWECGNVWLMKKRPVYK